MYNNFICVLSLKAKNKMETLYVSLHKVLHIENKEFKVIARLPKASNKSPTTDVLLHLQEMHSFVF